MKVILTGATGYIGGAVAEALYKGGHEIVAVARSDEASSRLKTLGYEPVRADMRDAEQMAALARDADAFVHAANTNDADNAAADAAMTRAVLRALEHTGKTFLYTSGVWSLGTTGAQHVDERASTDTPLAISAWRVPVEREVLDGAQRGVRTILMRPAIVHGRAGGIPAMLVEEARKRGTVRIIGDGHQEWPGVHIDDLAELYPLALEKATPGAILHAVASAGYPLRDIAVAASLAGGAQGRTTLWPLEEARRELGAFADALDAHQRVTTMRTRDLGWNPTRASVIEELLIGSYRD